jgi:hypothetical protein
MVNTPTQAAVRFLVFKEEGSWYAVALELGIVVDDDSPDAAFSSLLDAIRGVISLESDPKYQGSTFYRPEIDPEYERMWQEHQERGANPIQSPYQISMSGIRQVA